MNDESGSAPPEDTKPDGYEAPNVERVMDSEALAREVHYAGIPSPS